METVKKIRNGFTLVEVMLVIAIIGILASVIYPAYESWADGGSFSSGVKPTPQEVYYVICKDSHGEIHQTKGSRVVVENNTVIVKKRTGPDQTFINMDCWTEDATTHAEPEVRHDGG